MTKKRLKKRAARQEGQYRIQHVESGTYLAASNRTPVVTLTALGSSALWEVEMVAAPDLFDTKASVYLRNVGTDAYLTTSRGTQLTFSGGGAATGVQFHSGKDLQGLSFQLPEVKPASGGGASLEEALRTWEIDYNTNTKRAAPESLIQSSFMTGSYLAPLNPASSFYLPGGVVAYLPNSLRHYSRGDFKWRLVA